MVLYQWPTDLHAATRKISCLRAIRERNFHVLSLLLISDQRDTTSSMLGRFPGSSWTMSAISGSMNSNPLHFWVLGQEVVSLKGLGHRLLYNLRGPDFRGSIRR
jgi:hypothetical protein